MFAASMYLFTIHAWRPGTRKVHGLQFAIAEMYAGFDFVLGMSLTMIRPQRFLQSIHMQIFISAFVGFLRGAYGVIQKQVNTFLYLVHGAEVINDAYIKVGMNSLLTNSEYLPANWSPG